MDHRNQQDLVLQGRTDRGALPAYHGQPIYPARALEDDGEAALWSYWDLVKRHFWRIALSALAGLALGIGVSLLQGPVYRARTAVEVERPNERFLDLENLRPTQAADNYSIDSELATQIRIVTSRPLVRGVIERLGLTEELTPERGLRARLFGEAPMTATDAALENLYVEPAGLSRVVDIYFEHSDPTVAAEFSNALADEFIRHSIESRWQAAEKTAEWLSGELGSTRQQLGEMNAALQQMARSNGIVSLAGGSTLAEERLRLIQDDLSRAQSERITNQSQWEQARALSPNIAAETLDSEALRDHELQLAALRTELNALTTKFKPGYSGVKALQAQIGFLERKLEDERSQILARARNQFEAAVKREQMITEQHRLASGVVAVQKAKAIEFDLLRQEAETSRALYDNLLRKIKESAVAATIGATHIRVVDPAAAPRKPASPNYLLNAGLGLTLGCMLGLVLASSRSRNMPIYLEPGDIPRMLGTAELACIPTLTVPDARRLKTAGLLNLSKAQLDAGGSAISVAPAGDALATASYQNLMTSLLLTRRPGSPQVMVVSSANEGEGKSTTVYNLAVALAAGGERVLVVDGDLHHPVQHELFGLSQRTGLGDLLEVGADESGELGADEAKRSDQENLRLIAEGVVEAMHPDFKNLHLMTAGIMPSHAARLLHSRGFAAALMHRFHQFDVVLIDTPAVLDGPDARIFARIADGVALVVRAASTTVEEASAARDRFLSDRTPVAGAILNDCARDTDRARKTLRDSNVRRAGVRGGASPAGIAAGDAVEL